MGRRQPPRTQWSATEICQIRNELTEDAWNSCEAPQDRTFGSVGGGPKGQPPRKLTWISKNIKVDRITAWATQSEREPLPCPGLGRFPAARPRERAPDHARPPDRLQLAAL